MVTYRHAGPALLRAAREPIQSSPKHWPDLAHGDGEDLRAWLTEVWSRKDTAEAIALASPLLARRVEEVCAGKRLKAKQIRRAAASVARYMLRETGRPTPFGVFAGVACAGFGPFAKSRWGQGHRPLARVDTRWLADVVTRLEAVPPLLERLPVQLNTLSVVRGDRLVLPYGAGRVEIRHTAAVRAVERAAGSPIRFRELAASVTGQFPAVSPSTVRGMLTELVARGVLITGLRAPGTVTDTLAHVISQLREVGAEDVAQVVPTIRQLQAIHADLDRHNQAHPGEREQARAAALQRAKGLSHAARSPLAVDLWLDCDLELPEQVAHEMEAAASALVRLSAQPAGPTVWRDYYAAFCHRYGTGTMVPVTEVVDPDMGLGFPAGYPESLFAEPERTSPMDRDEQLLAWLQETALHGREEIVLDDETISKMGGDQVDPAQVPPHIELSARIHATSRESLDRGEFTLAVWPARAAGTMTGRFTRHGSAGWAEAFANLPTFDADAIPAQLSFPPAFPYAENISRTPRFLTHIISLGEHRPPGDCGVIPLDDLAVSADHHRLSLVSMSRRRPVEPQVFHALRLDKQPPAIVRFLAELPRSHTAAYTEFDWGAAAKLPYLPRVRYGRAVLSPARWRIAAADLPGARASFSAWRNALEGWQRRWHLPDTVELRDGDRMLRLDLTEPSHAAILRADLDRTPRAILTEAADEDGLGWLDGHTHEVAVPLVSTRTQTRTPVANGRPLIQAANHGGHLPGAHDSQWLSAKIYIHPDRQSEVIALHLHQLLSDLGEAPQWWFLRYRDPHDADHLRLRLRINSSSEYGAYAAAVGAWVEQLRQARLSWRLVLDTYLPEIGRYGDAKAMAFAESVFAADSEAVVAQAQRMPDAAAHPTALAAANMVDIAAGFTGSVETAMAWLIDHAVHDRTAPVPREVLHQAVALATDARTLHALPGWEVLAPKWEARRVALGAYRARLPAETEINALESLLHMHHVRAVGIDRESERVCRRLARSAALAWRERNTHQ